MFGGRLGQGLYPSDMRRYQGNIRYIYLAVGVGIGFIRKLRIEGTYAFQVGCGSGYICHVDIPVAVGIALAHCFKRLVGTAHDAGCR